MVSVPKGRLLALPAGAKTEDTEQGHPQQRSVSVLGLSLELVFLEPGQKPGTRRLNHCNDIVVGAPGFQAWTCPIS